MRLFNAARCLGLVSGSAFQALQHPVAHAGRTDPSKHQHCSEDDEPPQQGRYNLRSHSAAAQGSTARGRPPQPLGSSQLHAQQHAQYKQQWRCALSAEHAEQLRSSDTQTQQQRRASRTAAELAVQQQQPSATAHRLQARQAAAAAREASTQHRANAPIGWHTGASLNRIHRHDLGPRTQRCQHCHALLWTGEFDKQLDSSSLCCRHGKVDLDSCKTL
jgi:hypothetical protein